MADRPEDPRDNVHLFPRRSCRQSEETFDQNLREDRLCDLIAHSERLLDKVDFAHPKETTDAAFRESRRLLGLAMLETVQTEHDAIEALQFVLKRIAHASVEDATVHDTIQFHFISQVSTFLAKQLEKAG